MRRMSRLVPSCLTRVAERPKRFRNPLELVKLSEIGADYRYRTAIVASMLAIRDAGHQHDADRVALRGNARLRALDCEPRVLSATAGGTNQECRRHCVNSAWGRGDPCAGR